MSSNVQNNVMPTYAVLPNVLSEANCKSLDQFLLNPTPKKQWYGRTTYRTEKYIAEIVSKNKINIQHSHEHPGNESVDILTGLFLRTVEGFGVDLQNKKIQCEVYIDRNEVTKETTKSSGLFWHRDGTTTASGEAISTDYSMVYLISKDNMWQGGNMLIQQGGKAIGRDGWQPSTLPIIHLKPRHNQAIVFKNFNSGHAVEPIEPLETSVVRDVVIITCLLSPATS